MKSPRILLLSAAAVLLFAGAMMLVFWNVGGAGDPSEPSDPVAEPPGAERSENRIRKGATGAGTEGSTGVDRRPDQPDGDPAVRDPGFASDTVALVLDDREVEDLTVRDRLVQIAGNPEQPLAERSEALDHAFRMSLPDDITPLINLASSPRLPGELHDQILDGAMNFTGAPRLQLMLALLERADGERKDTLLDNLRFLTGEDHGDDLAKWRVAIEVLEPEAPEQ